MNCETPMIIRETSSGYFSCRITDDMLARREVECVTEITPDSAYSLIRQLRWLEREDPAGEITLLINSPGGSVNSGLAVYDVMHSLSCPVRTVCVGVAASMAAILFAAGSRREILPHGTVMIHDPLLSGGAGGSALQLQETSGRLLKCRKDLCAILARHTGKNLRQINKATAKDTYFDAREAVEFGLADRVVEKI